MRPQVSPAQSTARLFISIMAFVLPGYTFVLVGTLMSAVDKAFIGRLSSLQLASLGPATGSYDCSTFSLSFVGQATLALLGSPPPGVKRETIRSHALLFAASSGLVVGSLFLVFAVPVVRAFGASDAMVPYSVSYLRVRGLCMFMGRVRDVANQMCLAEKDTITPFISTLVAVAVNVVGDSLLCQPYGTLGAAVATDAASVAATSFVMRRLQHRGLWPRRLQVPSCADFAPFAEYAGPIFANNLLKMAAVASMGAFATRLGTTPGAAHQICASVWLLCGFALGMPLNWAARAFVQDDAEEEDNRHVARALLAVTAVAAVAGTCLAAALLQYGLGWFTRDALVVAEVAGAAPSVMTTVFLCVFYQSMEGILITQKRLQSLLRLGASQTVLFCFASCALYAWDCLTLPVLWAVLSAGVFVISSCTAMVLVDGFRGTRP